MNTEATIHRTVIDATSVAARLKDPDWRIADCRFRLTEPAAGRSLYDQGHIAGAVYAHLDDDLAGAVTGESGRHPLPPPELLAGQLGAWGIDADVQVVAYDDAQGAFAARLWWLLRWLGHERVAVLDGGLQAWTAAGFELSQDTPRWPPRTFTAQPHDNQILGTDQIAGWMEHGRLLDVRAAPRFAGEQEPIDPVAGHIPGAINHPFEQSLDENGLFLDGATIAGRFRQSMAAAPPDQVAVMCGSGVTACHALLALETAGLPGAKLYVGSWSEWIRDPGRPVEQGQKTG